MIKEIADLERLESCAKELKRRHFRPGFDNMDAAAALLWIQINGKGRKGILFSTDQGRDLCAYPAFQRTGRVQGL